VSTGARDAFRHHPATSVAVPGSALLALIAGCLVYVADRDWTSTMFLAPFASLQPPASGLFGPLGLVLPSFLHAYAFALLLIIALGRTRWAAFVGAGGWFVCAAVLELLQAEPLREHFFVTGMTGAPSPLIAAFQSYTVNGQFDPGDLLASLLGCASALAISFVREATP
jgi:hypothetical protein